MIKINISSDKSCCYQVPSDTMRWESHLISVVFIPPKHKPNLTKWETSERFKLKDILHSTWQVLIKIVKVMKRGNIKKFTKQRRLWNTSEWNIGLFSPFYFFFKYLYISVWTLHTYFIFWVIIQYMLFIYFFVYNI